MKTGFALAALAGVVATFLLIVHEGAGGVFRAIGSLGWWLAPIAAFHLVPLLLSAAAWRRATAARYRRSLGTFLALRWIREGISSLLPVAQIGGDVIGVRLLSMRGVPLPTAAASIVVDLTIELSTLGLFLLLGLVLLIAGSRWTMLGDWALAGIAALIVVAASVAAAQRTGALRLAERVFERLAGKSAHIHLPSIRELDDAVAARYADRPAIVGAAAFHLLSWLVAAGEIWLILHISGVGVDVGQALVIESLSHAVRAAGFFVPAALGVQEAGFIVLGALFGIAPETALALSLVRRVRELALGAPALLAWQAIEARRFRRRHRQERDPVPQPW